MTCADRPVSSRPNKPQQATIRAESNRGSRARESLEVFDSILPLLPAQAGGPRVTYNRGHIAVGTSGYNFCWFHPRKAAYCRAHFKMPADQRQAVIDRLESAGIESAIRGRSSVRMRIAKEDVGKNRQLLTDVLGVAEQWSRR